MAGPARGFSLVEVLVAFVITSVSLGLILQIYAKGTDAIVLAEEYAGAQAIAESKLAVATVPEALRTLGGQGREQDKYEWELTVEDHVVEELGPDAQSSYGLLFVDVAVSWRSRGKLRRINLQTLKPAVHSIAHEQPGPSEQAE